MHLILHIPVPPMACESTWRADPRPGEQALGQPLAQEAKKQSESGSAPATAPRMWVSLLSYRLLLKPNFPYSCFHRQICVMLKFLGRHKVGICSTLSSLHANLHFFSVSAGVVDMHNFICSTTAEFSIQIPHFTALWPLKDEKLYSC